MNRRRYLAVVGVLILARGAGCLDAVGDRNRGGDGGETGAGAGTETDASHGSTPSETPDSARDVRIVVRNSTADGATVRLAVSRDGATFFEDEVGVPQTGGRTVDPGIDETGSYELEVAVEGGTDGSYPFSVEEYDLRMGSNLIVDIGEDDVRMTLEE